MPSVVADSTFDVSAGSPLVAPWDMHIRNEVFAVPVPQAPGEPPRPKPKKLLALKPVKVIWTPNQKNRCVKRYLNMSNAHFGKDEHAQCMSISVDAARVDGTNTMIGVVGAAGSGCVAWMPNQVPKLEFKSDFGGHVFEVKFFGNVAIPRKNEESTITKVTIP